LQVAKKIGKYWRKFLGGRSALKRKTHVERHSAGKRAVDRESEFPEAESLYGLEAGLVSLERFPVGWSTVL